LDYFRIEHAWKHIDIETRASDTKLGDRKVAALDADRPLMIEGVDCSEYVKPHGRIHIPTAAWKKQTKESRDAVMEMEHNAQKRGDEGVCGRNSVPICSREQPQRQEARR